MVVIDRAICGSGGLETIVVTSFGDAGTFKAWCDQQPLRFEYPLLFEQLVRNVNDLFSHDEYQN